MTLHYVTGSIFESKAVNLVNPVNCVGVMGAGLALEFKKRFPSIVGLYQYDCENQLLHPGGLRFYAASTKNIVCAATKDHWRDPSTLEWVESCLVALVRCAPIWGDIALPQLGCGKGGLAWEDVRSLMEKHLSFSTSHFYVHTVDRKRS